MKPLKSIFAASILGLALLSSCSDPRKDITTLNWTETDTEAFKFLKEVYVEAAFQQYAAANYELGGPSAEIASTYKTIASELEALADENRVRLPELGENPFEQTAGYSPQSEPTMTQSNDTVNHDRASEHATSFESHNPPQAKTDLQGTHNPSLRVIHSQEKILHHFENASINTNLSIRNYASERLHQIEELLKQTQSSLK